MSVSTQTGTNWSDKLEFAPVVICPYTRYDILKKVIDALRGNTLAFETASIVPFGQTIMRRLCVPGIDVKAGAVREDPGLVGSFHRWLLKVHLKLLVRYLLSLGPLRKYLGKRNVICTG